jgi:hypothetical protein
MTDGAGLVDISRQLVVLAVWTGLSFVLAMRLFKWR